jgi:hypothetical protein
MISPEALAALSSIEHGAQFNTLHSTARELMDLGFACDDWGKLGLTEAGRVYLRRGKFSFSIISDENVCDLTVHRSVPHGVVVDPMAAPHLAHSASAPVAIDLLAELPAGPLPVAETRMQEMLRAAGVASGITGVWVDAEWLEEFARALEPATPAASS